MRTVAAVALLACACGGGVGGGGGDDDGGGSGEPLAAAPVLTIAARPGDELVFIEPDTKRDGFRHTAELFVTGSATDDVLAAYARDAGAGSSWTCGEIALGSGRAEHCRQDDAALSLVFLGVPDGALLDLWEGNIAQTGGWTQRGLVAAVADAIDTTAPATIRTTEIAATHGSDDSDRMFAGALALLGLAASTGSGAPVLISFRGDNVAGEPADEPADDVADSALLLGGSGDAAAALLARRYAVGFRRPAASVQIVNPALGGQCLGGDASGVRLLDCATAPSWALTAGGALQLGSDCIEALPTGELVMSACDPAQVAPPVEHWSIDDEGHIWSGAPPAPADDMDYAHLDCLGAGQTGGKVHAALCGGSGAPTWQLRGASIGEGGIAVRAGALAGPDGLETPAGTRIALADVDGDGLAEFLYDDGSAVQYILGRGLAELWSGPPMPLGALAIDPSTFAAGDLDGDGLADACGAGSAGIACLIGGAPTAPSDLTFFSGPISIADRDLCGVTATGSFACAGGSAAGVVATLPAAGTAALAGPGDAGSPLGCALAAGSVACADAHPSPELATWSYASGGTFDSACDGTVAGTALADLDGDGHLDVCSLDAATGRVLCARGQGHGFGPQFVVLDGTPADTRQIALGDIDGDGRADVCAIGSAGAICALSP